MPLISFNGSHELKAAILADAIRHRDADEYIQRTYGEDTPEGFRGCDHGCFTRDLQRMQLLPKDVRLYDHRNGEAIGIPAMVMRLRDTIFERLPADEAPAMAAMMWEATPVGADLSNVGWLFLIEVLERAKQYAWPDGRLAIEQVVLLLNRKVTGQKVTEAEAINAVDTDCAAALSAYGAARAAMASSAAAHAAEVACAAAEASSNINTAYAARAADRAAVAANTANPADGATTEARWQRDTLARLLSEAPIVSL